MFRIGLAFTVAVLAAACSHDAALVDDGSTTFDAAASQNAADLAVVPGADQASAPKGDLASSSQNIDPTLVADRPYGTKIPDDYDGKTPVPLLVLLHGFSADGQLQDFYLALGDAAVKKGWLYAFPDGLQNPAGLRYWDATDACCNFADPPQDDVAYLDAVIADMKSKYNVDPKRVFLFGHSNGGFMSHRMACDSAPTIAAIVSLAGAQWDDVSKCQPKNPVGVVELHGTADLVINYNGGSVFPGGATYPSAPTTVADWATLNGCGAVEDTGETFDADSLVFIPQNETKIARASGCKQNGAAELWSMQGSGHVPILTDDLRNRLFDFYEAHHKP